MPPSHQAERGSRSAWQRVLLWLVLAGTAYGCWLRIATAHRALLFGDEFHSLRSVAEGYRYIVSHFDQFGSGLALPLLQRLLSDAFGLNHGTIRGVALLGGLLAIALVYRLGAQLVDRSVGLVAALLLALNSFHIFYSGFARSYALVSALGVVYVAAMTRLVAVVGAVETEQPRQAPADRRALLALVASATLLPYLHLTALGLMLPVAVVAAIDLLAAGRVRRLAVVGGALAAAALATLLLHVPAWDSLQAFVGKKAGAELPVDFGALDVAALLLGSRAGALASIALVALAALALAGAAQRRALLLVAGCFGPVVALVMARPYGDAYAYARYLVPVVPLACLTVAWGLSVAARRIGLGATTVLLVGLVLGTAQLASGSYGIRRTEDGRFANTYMNLYPLPPFDAPWPGAPGFYAQLARDDRALRVIEAPCLKSRTQHLYRTYALQHGKDTWLGFVSDNGGSVPAGPYVCLVDPEWRRTTDADYLIVHRDVEQELERYWKFVYSNRNPALQDDAIAAYMARHGIRPPHKRHPSPELLAELGEQLGPPIYDADGVVVWEL